MQKNICNTRRYIRHGVATTVNTTERAGSMTSLLRHRVWHARAEPLAQSMVRHGTEQTYRGGWEQWEWAYVKLDSKGQYHENKKSFK